MTSAELVRNTASMNEKLRPRTIEATRLLSIADAADRLGISARTLQDRRYRERIGFRGIRIGRKIKFSEVDLVRFLACNHE